MSRRIGLLVGLAFCVASTARASQGNAGIADPDLLIGSITTYPSETAARLSCKKDPVVWADRYAGYYYWPREKQYGATDQGAFACLHDALKGNYWDTSPMSSMAHQPGKNFPYTPLYVGS